jgi:branched-chain amino acid transport system substrate-binding protein
MSVKRILGAAAAATLAFSVSAAVAETKGPVTDDLGVVEIDAGAPITIGLYWVISGADAALGIDSKRAVEIALKDRGGKIKGRDVQLVEEDDGCNAEGGQTVGTKLAAVPNIVGVLGGVCSSATTAAAPILWKQGILNICTACTAAKLTAPDRKADYAGFMRTIYSDADQAKNDAKWFREGLKCDTLATIHDGSPYAQGLAEDAGKNFEALGGKWVAAEAVTPTDVDMRPVLTSIGTKKPCALYFPIFIAAGAQIAKQVGEISDLKDTNIIGGSAMQAAAFLEAAGDAAKGLRFTTINQSNDVLGKKYPEFVEKYKADYGEAPIQSFHQFAYDALMVLADAIEKVAVEDGGKLYIGRKALRDASFATTGMDGLSGPISCNEHGSCGAFNFAVYQFTSGDPATFKTGENPIRLYPQ